MGCAQEHNSNQVRAFDQHRRQLPCDDRATVQSQCSCRITADARAAAPASRPHLSGRAAGAKPREAGVGFSDTLLPSAMLVAVAMAIVSTGVSCLRGEGVRGVALQRMRADARSSFRLDKPGQR